MSATRKLVFDSKLLPDGHLYCPKELADKKNLQFKVVVSYEIENDLKGSEEEIEYMNLNNVSDSFISEQQVEYYLNLESGQSDQKNQNGERMAQCLEKIANAGGITGISDPAEWQHEIREERSIYFGNPK